MYRDCYHNKYRDRSYGLRIGDIVSLRCFGKILYSEAEVIRTFSHDNNRVAVRIPEKIITWTAEHCDIVTKVEERLYA